MHCWKGRKGGEWVRRAQATLEASLSQAATLEEAPVTLRLHSIGPASTSRKSGQLHCPRPVQHHRTSIRLVQHYDDPQHCVAAASSSPLVPSRLPRRGCTALAASRISAASDIDSKAERVVKVAIVFGSRLCNGGTASWLAHHGLKADGGSCPASPTRYAKPPPQPGLLRLQCTLACLRCSRTGEWAVAR